MVLDPPCLKEIFVFFSVSLLHSSLWLPTTVVKNLKYSHATIKIRINTVRPLPSSNHRHRVKLHLRDLLNLIKFQAFIKLRS